MITKKYYKLIRVSHADEGYFYIKNVSNEIGEFKIKNYTSGTMEYSLDGVTWTSYDLTNKPGVNVNPNSNIYLRGTNFYRSGGSGSIISFNKDYIICGNYMSLIDYSTMGSVTTLENAMTNTFYGETNLISAVYLNFGNVTTFNSSALSNTFYGCSSLSLPPDFSNITTIGDNGLSATFQNCSSLTTVPDLSSVTSVGTYGLYNTFNNCGSLTTGLNLSSVTQVGDKGLAYTYRYCNKISNVTTPNVSVIGDSVCYGWLISAGGQATGTKVVNVPTGATIEPDSDVLPSGWTRVDY